VIRVILSAIIGGILVFAWSMVSWMALPYHAQSISQFKDEAALTKLIKEHADHSGVYVLPFVANDTLSKPADEQRKIWEEVQKKQQDGPLVFASVALNGTEVSMKQTMVYGLILQIAGAFIISLILWGFCCSGYFCRLFTVISIGLTVGLLGSVPGLIWWKFSLPFTLACGADALIGWTIAGLLMAAIVKPCRCKKESR
jgi:hypothetical protein